MSGFLGGLLGELLGASFRGVPFQTPDVRQEIGRRVVRLWFPGRDDTRHQDLGLAEGPINVTGFVVGDDYVQRARELRDAFAEPGPGTLVHPWLGEIEVVLARPAIISFSEREIRLARFEATFEPWSNPAPAPLDTLSQMLDAVARVRAQIRATLRQLLAPVRQTVAALAAVQAFCGSAESTWRGLLGGAGFGVLSSALELPFRDLAGIGSLAAGDDYGGIVADRLTTVPLAISGAGAPPLLPAIGPAAGATVQAEPVIDPAAGAGIMLQAATAFAAASSAVAALPVLAAAMARAEVAISAADIDHVSSQDAMAWRDRAGDALLASANAVAALTPAWPTVAPPLWDALTDLHAALVADFNARIGRLPTVRILPARAAAVPAWLIAWHLAGADPGRVGAMLDDLVRRNRLRQPGQVPAALELEYLA